MDNEMKKLLLVAVSVGVFLLVTITVALIVITPKAQMQETSFSSSVPYANTRPAPNNTGNLPVLIDESLTPVSFNGNERTEVTIASDRNDGNNLTIHIPATVLTESETTPVSSTQTPSTQMVRTQPASSTVQTTQAVKPASQPAAASRSTTQSSTAAKTVPASAPSKPSSGKTINDYWIQTGAFSAIVRAEDAREILASKGLISIIENRIIDGRTWYRVRLGPYTSEKEANHWLAIVKAIDGFSQSQIRQSVRQQ